MKILLTGAGGFIGSALLPLLVERGHGVRALYRSSMPVLQAGVENIQGDLADEILCRQICQGVDAVIHLAGQAHVQCSKGSHIRNTYETTSKLAKSAGEEGVQQFIYISSTKANYPAHSAYAAIKLATETHLLQLHAHGDLKVVCLRPALVYGAGMKGNLATLLRWLQRPRLPVFPGSSTPLGMISREDCCQAIVTALECGMVAGRSWELHDGQDYTLESLVQAVRNYLALPQPLLTVPRACMQVAAWLASVSAPFTGISVGLGTYRAMYAEPYRRDDSFSQHTGFHPQQTFYNQLPALMESIA